MIDWEGMERRRDARSAEIKNSYVSGIDPTDMKPGMRVTMSPNLSNGDRSWADEVLTIIALNAGHIQLRLQRPFLSRTSIVVNIPEHHFYLADSFEDDTADETLKSA